MLPNATKYADYTSTDFFKDEQYIRYLLQEDEEAAAYWLGVATAYPEKKGAMKEAAQWILLLNKQKPYTPPKAKEQVWQQLAGKTSQAQQKATKVKKLKRSLAWVGSIAATLLLFVVLQDWQQQGEKTVGSDYGKVEEVALPDKTTITLNGNSKIWYNRNWLSSKPREVWLQGEAYFEVTHTAVKNRLLQSDSFRVHADNLYLTVTGTRFNTKVRRNAVEVSVLEGSVRINKETDGSLIASLKAGETLLYRNDSALLSTDTLGQSSANDWVQRQMNLEGQTLGEILQTLEDTYGYQVNLQATGVANKKLVGAIPASNAEDILFVLKKVFNLNISQNGRRLTITNN